MSQLTVHVDCGSAGAQQLPIEVIDAQHGTARTEPVEDGHSWTLPLPPGHYLVQTVLPDGTLLSDQTTVTEGEHVDVTLGQPWGDATSAMVALDRGVDLDRGVGAAESHSAGVVARLRWIALWRFDGADATWRPVPWGGWPVTGTQDSLTMSIGPSDDALHALQVGGDVPSAAVVLPPSPEPVTVALRSDAELGVAFDVRTANAQAESLLAYLTSGQLTSATMLATGVVDAAEGLLFAKTRDPVGAVIGALFLLRTRQLKNLHSWPRNLADWFGWFPDAPAVRAAQLLATEPTERTRPGAATEASAAAATDPSAELRQRLLTAAHAGATVYTESLRWVYEGLQTLAAGSPHQPDVAAALTRVHAYADACDWDRPLTTFWGSPGSPTLEPRRDAHGPDGAQRLDT